MKRILSAVVVIAAFGGACTGGPDRYSSAAAIAADLRAGDVSCEGYAAGEGAELLSDQASCTYGTDELGIYVFEDGRARDRWLRVGARLDEVVVGPNWVVDPSGRPDAVAEALDGDIR